jgi:ATP-dependent exoDNAse (exonuclease V) beta subunit
MYQASAGAGKTFQLVHRYISLLARGARPEAILATTFSRKAAHEIFQRIITRLLECVDDSSAAEEVAHIIESHDFDSTKAGELLASLLEQISSLPIETLDSFAQRFGRLFSTEIGLPETWDIPSEYHMQQLEQSVLEMFMEGESPEKRHELLHLITKFDASRNVFERIFQKLSRLTELSFGVSPTVWEWEFEALEPRFTTTSTKTAQDVIEQFRMLSIPLTKGGKPDQRWEKMLTKSIQLLETGSWGDFLGSRAAKSVVSGDKSFSGKPFAVEWEEAFHDALSLISIEVAENLIRKSRFLGVFLDRYQSYLFAEKSRTRRYGFSDVKTVLAYAIHSLDMLHIAYRMDRRISHVLIDEFQDTTRTEWKILSKLTDEIAAAPSSERSALIVGDPKQGIYGWRGGVADLFKEVRERYPHLEMKPLKKSFRSSPIIISFLNDFFLHLQQEELLQQYSHVVADWLDGFTPHEAAKESAPGFVTMEWLSRDEAESDDDVACIVAEQAKTLLQVHSGLEIAILVRKNREILPYVRACEALDLHVSAEGGSPLTDSPVVVACLHLLQAVCHPADTRSLYHVEQTPLASWLFHEYGESEVGLGRLSIDIEQIGLAPMLQRIIRAWDGTTAPKDVQRCEQLMRLALNHDTQPHADLADFIRFVRSERVQDEGAGIVRIMTVHKSKGLEFDAVFLPQLHYAMNRLQERDFLKQESRSGELEKIIPFPDQSMRSLFAHLDAMHGNIVGEQVKEELSVLYVALSRAKHGLYFYLREAGSQKTVTPAELIASRFIPDRRSKYEVGDPHWMCSLSVEKEINEVATSREVPPVTWKSEEKRHRFFPTKKPSQREGAISHRQSTSAEARGRLVHNIIERIDWLSEEIRNPKYLEELHTECSIAMPHISRYAIEEVLSLLTAEPVASCFNHSRYQCSPTALRLYRELPFSFIEEVKNGKQHIVTGVIDRIVVVEETWIELIEFKTGYLRHELDDLHSQCRGQMTLYMKALSGLFPHIRLVRPTVCFLDRGQLLSLEMPLNSPSS